MQFTAAADPRHAAFHSLQPTLTLGGRGGICRGQLRAPGAYAYNGGGGTGLWQRRQHGCRLRAEPLRAVPAGEARWRSRRRGSLVQQVLRTERGPSNVVSAVEGPAERIKKALQEVEPPMSSYDTAWVAMVPSSERPAEAPQFPRCIDWILEHQHPDGSWGPHQRGHPRPMKDALSSTLACAIALKRWNCGEEHIEKGIEFILSNLSFIRDEEQQHSPVGFGVIFPRMIGMARDMGLRLPMSQTEVDAMLQLRELELERASRSSSKGAEAYLAYIAEGLDSFPEWKDLRKYQREDGSLFHSPSTTAAALTHHRDAKCLKYLSSVVQKFGNAVPARYPFDTYANLHKIDCLERFGIDQLFGNEIKTTLDEVYRQWLLNDEEITSDIATRAMAFRLLRMHGYEVSAGFFTHVDEDFFYDSLEGHLEDTKAVLELYKASQLKFPAECFLDKLNLWTGNFLAKQISNISTNERINGEVDHALKFPSFSNAERLEHRRNIAHSNIDNLQILKTSHALWNVESKDILDLAAQEFNVCQSIHRKELEYLKRWFEENKLNQLTFAREKLSYCHFVSVGMLFSSEMSDFRISSTQNGVLLTLVDDFFDVAGSEEEHINLVQLIERWEENYETKCCSEKVRILYAAIHNTVNELGKKASIVQKCDVTSHIIEIWLDTARSMMEEAKWRRKKIIPNMEQYMANGYVSVGVNVGVLPALYFIGPKLYPAAIKDPDYLKMFQLTSICGRLLNDIQGFKRESIQGKLNSVSLLMLEGDGSISEGEAKERIQSLIKYNREELLKFVLEKKRGAVPKACKDPFLKMCRILHFFYMSTDGFTSPTAMVHAVNATIHEPI